MPPVRSTVSVMLPTPSTTLAVADVNWTVLSLSLMVTVSGLFGPRAAAPRPVFTKAERSTVNVRSPLMVRVLRIGIVITALVAPAAMVRSPPPNGAK